VLKSISIENFRGIRSLTVQDLGRVTLIVGKNETGKTALAEAIAIGEVLPNAFSSLATLQSRRDRTLPVVDFDEFWRPIFWRGEVERGISFSWERADDGRLSNSTVRISRELASPVVTDASVQQPGWSLVASGAADGVSLASNIVGGPLGVQFPPLPPSPNGIWVGPASGEAASVSTSVQTFSRASQAGRYASVLEVVKMVDESITDIEVLAPAGFPRLYVRRANSPLALPVTMMGDGFQRCLDIACAFGQPGHPAPVVDELENGLHHSVLPSLWRWIKRFTASSSMQLFATTHSEECVLEATRAFQESDDNGLRIVRLDRVGDDTRATVYDSKLLQAAERMSVDVRG
jgi:hypothetical protein